MMEEKFNNNRSLAGILIIAIIFLSLFFINQWLIGQMNDIAKEMTEEKGNTAPSPIPVDEDAHRYGIPQIDSANDPLAPVIVKDDPSQLKQEIEPVNGEGNTKKQYEFAIQDVNLPQ